MQAAFIDIGEEKNAFLYKDDVIPKDIESDSLEELRNLSITDLLREDQEILVQMIKEPIGTKGARVVTQITLPGRYLVLIPSVDYVGVSRRIEDEAERERLKSLVTRFKTPGIGLIIRTAAQEVELSELQNDYEFLVNVWKKIQKKARKGACPALVYRDHDLLYRVLRDYLSKDIHRLLIDENDAYLKALELVQSLAPSLKSKIHHYNEKIALFDTFNIESQLEKAMRRKVWLDSGAYLVFDQTEALSVIDVNTGKFTGSVSLEDTVFQTNLSAVIEIARQIRLRNLAGIIIIDFIDMVSDAERAQVIEQLKAQFERDKIKANILGFTSLGLLELTRKKVKQSLREILQTECDHCEGTGYRVSLDNLAHRAVRAIQQIAQRTPEPALLLGVNPQVGSLLIGPGGVNLEKTEKNLNKIIFIKGQDYLSLDQVRLLASGDKDEIEMLAFPVREGSETDLRILEAHMSNPADGIARLEGYIINVEGAGIYIGKKIRVVITKTYRTYARAKLPD
jgi:ribonuclease G